MRSFALAGLLLCLAIPACGDTVFNVELSNITFSPINPEVVNASFNWDVTTATISDIFICTSPLVFTVDEDPSPVGQHEINGVTYLHVAGLGYDIYGDVLQIDNEFTDEIPAIPGTYDAGKRVGQVFFSCGQDCAQTIGYTGWMLAQAGTITVTSVPEPASISLLLFGLCSLFPIMRKVLRTSN